MAVTTAASSRGGSRQAATLVPEPAAAIHGAAITATATANSATWATGGRRNMRFG